jgi:hypothetical protein
MATGAGESLHSDYASHSPLAIKLRQSVEAPVLAHWHHYLLTNGSTTLQKGVEHPGLCTAICG